jgi:hypothetical protein
MRREREDTKKESRKVAECEQGEKEKEQEQVRKILQICEGGSTTTGGVADNKDIWISEDMVNGIRIAVLSRCALVRKAGG